MGLGRVEEYGDHGVLLLSCTLSFGNYFLNFGQGLVDWQNVRMVTDDLIPTLFFWSKAMLTLWLNRNQINVDEKGCRQLLDAEAKWSGGTCFFALDGTKCKTGRFKTPGPVFVWKSRPYKVSKDRFQALVEACKAGLTGPAEFQVGWRPISSTATGATMLKELQS